MIKAFFAYYKPYKLLFALDFTASVLMGILELAFPLVTIWFIDTLIPAGDWNAVVWGAVGLFALYVFNTLMSYIVHYWGHVLGVNIETEMRRRSFEHINKLSFNYFDNQKTGHIIGRITKDLDDIGEFAHHGPEDAFAAIMTFVGALVVMLYTHTELGLITAVTAPFLVWLSLRYGGQLTTIWKRTMEQVGVFNQRIEETVGGIRVVKSFTNEAHEIKLFAGNNQQYRSIKLDFYRSMASHLSASYFCTRIMQVIVMIAGSYYVMDGTMSNGEFVGFIFLVGVFIRPIERMNSLTELYTNGMAGFKRYQEFLATEPDIKNPVGAVPLNPPKKAIVFNDVDFTYNNHIDIFNKINITIPIGKTTAFVGESGAGKSTICALIPRFYDIQGGSITIDDQDITTVTLESLRGYIGIVEQSTYLFGGTLRENIAYGQLDATDAQILDAADKAYLTTMIEELPDGLDTIVGERGVKLSGGQKQRIAIARVFLKNPKILILDEATSSLDTQSEIKIQQALQNLSKGRTTIVIAHRLSTVTNADQIIVIKNGQVRETGTHKKLLAKKGEYANLVKAQALK